ncbi:uncharacterized protein LOC134509070 [Chroicocephalus ridibundus]|uniref:uncharacterized protein LOC134509070 n=1 Tax=Chroicocephalus ridibundus TaxID=1192867 RepID=UPI002FDDF5A8
MGAGGSRGSIPAVEQVGIGLEESFVSPQDEEEKGSSKSTRGINSPLKESSRQQTVSPGDISWWIGHTEPNAGLVVPEGEAAFSSQLSPGGICPHTHNAPAAEGGHLSLRESFVAREDGEKKTGQGQPGKVSAGSGHQTAQARTPQGCRKEAQEIVTLNVKRIFTILFLLNLAALVGSCCGILQLMWMQGAEDVAQEVRLMGEAMSASTQMSDWALKEAGAAMDLQRSSSSSAGLCRVFWFLCAPAPQDTFVQPDALPGYYWPFQWSRSKQLIRSPTQIQATAITRDQTSKMASALGTVSSAPRDFTVSGPDEEGEQETLLGTSPHTLQKGPNETFPLQNGIPRGFPFLKLGIRSNWGKPGYTCIYRVQVHGKIMGRKAVGQTPV